MNVSTRIYSRYDLSPIYGCDVSAVYGIWCIYIIQQRCAHECIDSIYSRYHVPAIHLADMAYLLYMDMIYLLSMGHGVSISYNEDVDIDASTLYIADMTYLLQTRNNVCATYGIRYIQIMQRIYGHEHIYYKHSGYDVSTLYIADMTYLLYTPNNVSRKTHLPQKASKQHMSQGGFVSNFEWKNLAAVFFTHLARSLGMFCGILNQTLVANSHTAFGQLVGFSGKCVFVQKMLKRIIRNTPWKGAVFGIWIYIKIEYSLFYRALLQKRPEILKSLLYMDVVYLLMNVLWEMIQHAPYLVICIYLHIYRIFTLAREPVHWNCLHVKNLYTCIFTHLYVNVYISYIYSRTRSSACGIVYTHAKIVHLYIYTHICICISIVYTLSQETQYIWSCLHTLFTHINVCVCMYLHVYVCVSYIFMCICIYIVYILSQETQYPWNCLRT